MTKQFPSNQQIIDYLNADYGIKTNTLTQLPIGADFNAKVYKAVAHDKSYFIKVKDGHNHDISATILALLQDAGIQHIIPPIKANNGQSIQQIDEFALIVAPFIDGHDGFSRDLSDNQWVTLGKTMKKIHDIDVPLPIQRMIRHEDFSPKYREAVRSLYALIGSKSSTDEISSQFIKYMKDHAHIVHRLVDRAEQLGNHIQDQLPEFVLCHSDIHGGNILIDGNDFIYVIDWDAPIMAPKERDLMFIGGGINNVWNKPQEASYFYQGYGEIEINMPILAYYRHERIVEDIAEFGEQLLLPPGSDQNRAEAYDHFIAQFEPGGVVEIAFKTDEEYQKI